MTTVRISERIDAPQKLVFDVFSDFAHAAERIEDIKELELLTDGPIGVGTRFRETRVMFGKEATEVMEIRAFDPPNSYYVTAASHGSKYETTYTFTPEGDATRVDVEFTGTPISFAAKLMTPLFLLMSGTLKKCLSKDIADLKRVIAEQRAGA